MKVVPLFDAKNRLSHYVDESRRRPVIITRNGRPCAALVAVDDDIEAFLLAHHPAFLALLDRSYQRGTRQGTVPLSVVEKEVARRERRRRARGTPRRSRSYRSE